MAHTLPLPYGYMNVKILVSVACLALLASAGQLFAQFYQGSFMEFGKNRVQYRTFLWQQYRFDKFDTYYYEGGQPLAEFVSKVAERNIRSVEDIFDYNLSDKIQFIVYNTQTDFKQSNVGLSMNDANRIGGTSTTVGSKVFVFFDGDHKNFEKQIKEGISRILVSQVLYGGGWRDIIRTNAITTMPEWYVEGLILYASKNVNSEADSRIRSGILSKKFEKFNRLEGIDAHLAGYALWEYVAMVYGENILPNILYMARVSRNIESGFLFVLGKSLDTIHQEFLDYYRGEYAVSDIVKEEVAMEEIEIKVKKEQVVTQFELSPDGRHLAYVTNVMGQYRLYLLDTETGTRKKILKAEHKLERIPDYSFPVLTWHPSSSAFTYITERRGRLVLNTYNLDDKKTTSRELFQLDKVLSMNYSSNGQQMVFSGVYKGRTNLYLYYLIGNRQEQLTNDQFDDLDPSFTKDGNKILFVSNRLDDTLRVKPLVTEVHTNKDVYAFNLRSRSRYLERITNTPGLVERKPFHYKDNQFTYLADYEGTVNRYVASYDSTISSIDTIVNYRYVTKAEAITNYRTDLLAYSAHPLTGNYGSYVFKDGKYRFFKGNFREDLIGAPSARKSDEEKSDEDGSSTDSMAKTEEGVEHVKPIILSPRERSSNEINIRNYTFEGERSFEYVQETVTITEIPQKKRDYRPMREGITFLDSLNLPGARNYNLNFSIDETELQIDNTFLTNFYQPITGGQRLNPGIGPMLGASASDLFEDYRLYGGVRFNFGIDNLTYLAAFDDLSKRLDKRIVLIRESNRFQSTQTQQFKVITYQGNYRLSYPINEVLSLRGTAILRHEQFISLAIEQSSLTNPNSYSNFAGLKGEVVFDNTIGMGLNIMRGIRAKGWAEYYRDPFNSATTFMVFGADMRQYHRIHRNLIWANRLAWSSSIGSERLAYFLGGVDNWLAPRNDESVPLATDQNFRYQTLGTPMRGFIYNVRNGNSFAVINSELRWPIFKYLFNRPLKSDFLENFQVVGFGDVGSAWTGPSPFSPENAFNSTIITRGDVTIEVENNRDPIVYGYGFGLRSRLFGYFIRADWAWGIDDGIRLPSVFYLSLALDF